MLKTDSYIDDKYVILDETLLSISDSSDPLVIPSEVNGHPIKRIGSGLYAGENIKTILISEGIEEIGERAFTNCKSLEKVILPESLKIFGDFCFDTGERDRDPATFLIKRVLSKEDYENIKNNSIPVLEGGARLLTPGHASLPEFAEIYKGMGLCGVPRRLDKDMRALNIYRKIDKKGNVHEVEEIPFVGTPFIRKKAEDYKKPFMLCYVQKLLGNSLKYPYDDKSEREHERNVQVENKRKPSIATLTLFDENGAVEKDGRVSATFQMKSGLVFFGSLTKVVYKGKDYYVYRENFIQPSYQEIDYVATDYFGFVVDSEGNVADEEVSKAVTVKYKLPMMLS
jgi:hypothetical protein